MIPIKKGISTLRDEGPNQLLGDVAGWTRNKAELAMMDDTVSRAELRQSADYVYDFSEEEQVTITPWNDVFQPSNYDAIRVPDERYEFERPFVAEIYDGRILRDNGYCATEDYSIILDSGKSTGQIHSEISTVELLKNEMKSSLNISTQYDLDTAVALTSIVRPSSSSNFTNYYVWVHTYLTKLEGIKKYTDNTGTDLDILIPANSPSWVLQSLNFFGFSDNVVFWNPNEELSVRKLIIPSNRRIEKSPDSAHSKFLSPIACKWLREEAKSCIDKSNTEFSDKVFISRNDAGRRELRNKTDVFDLLKDRGFISYNLSELSFKQQVELFSQANQVVGVHGAGLVNLLFSSDCNVVEIFGDSLAPTYFLLAESCGLGYQAISGQSIDDATVPLHHQDIRIDPSKVNNCLDKIS